jgi:hypothetical protein
MVRRGREREWNLIQEINLVHRLFLAGINLAGPVDQIPHPSLFLSALPVELVIAAAASCTSLLAFEKPPALHVL